MARAIKKIIEYKGNRKSRCVHLRSQLPAYLNVFRNLLEQKFTTKNKVLRESKNEIEALKKGRWEEENFPKASRILIKVLVIYYLRNYALKKNGRPKNDC